MSPTSGQPDKIWKVEACLKPCLEISWRLLEPVTFSMARSVAELVESAPSVQAT